MEAVNCCSGTEITGSNFKLFRCLHSSSPVKFKSFGTYGTSRAEKEKKIMARIKSRSKNAGSVGGIVHFEHKMVSNIVSKKYPQQQMLFMYDVGTLGFSGRRCIHVERELMFRISYN